MTLAFECDLERVNMKQHAKYLGQRSFCWYCLDTHTLPSARPGPIMYKCSAVAEMGDRLATIDMGRKLGAVPLIFWEGRCWIPI